MTAVATPLRAIDLFSGLGGFSTGARAAGVEVVWAANHWKLAVEYHERNHPLAQHKCQDLHQADWSLIPDHDIGLASPSCQGFSPARGKHRPHHDVQRSTMWAVVACAEYHRESAWLIENVPAVLDWELFPAWKDAMQRLGYSVAPHVVDAADFGVPQHRERLFMVLTRSRAPLYLDLPKMPHVPVNSVIDWYSEKWSPIYKKGRSPATIARVENGRARFGDQFVAPFYGSGSGLTGRSVDRPIGTITTRDRWAVVNGDRMRMLNKNEVRQVMGFPESTKLPPTHKESIHLMGNAVCPPVPETFLRLIQAHA